MTAHKRRIAHVAGVSGWVFHISEPPEPYRRVRAASVCSVYSALRQEHASNATLTYGAETDAPRAIKRDLTLPLTTLIKSTTSSTRKASMPICRMQHIDAERALDIPDWVTMGVFLASASAEGRGAHRNITAIDKMQWHDGSVCASVRRTGHICRDSRCADSAGAISQPTSRPHRARRGPANPQDASHARRFGVVSGGALHFWIALRLTGLPRPCPWNVCDG
jgi:hypothetical protein